MAVAHRGGVVQGPSALRSPQRRHENGARVKITAGHIGWADLIFCMERRHADRLRENFPTELTDKKLVTLRIPDDYGFMDPALIELLRTELHAYLDRWPSV